jgi:predicted MFS family arabinose efflux permease
VLVGTGLLCVVFGLVRAQAEGWTSPLIVASLGGGIAVLAAFVAWERRTQQPMLPLELFARRTFAVTNGVSFFMYFGTFGAIFLLTQYTQLVMGFEPLEAGVRMLVWTGATAITAPIAGVLAERHGPRPFMATGLALLAGSLAWVAATAGTTTAFGALAAPFALAGAGMALVFSPSASALLSVVSPERAGQASGTNNAIREVGGVFGVAVLSSIFAHAGGFGSPQAFVDGFVPAVWVGAAVVGLGALVALLLPSRRAGVAPAGVEPVAVAA